MSNAEILQYIDNMNILERRKNNIYEKILSVQMGGLTICTETQVLTPEDQCKILFQEWQTAQSDLERYENLLRSLTPDDLTSLYLALMEEEPSPAREIHLNSLVRLIQQSQQKEKGR